MLVSGPAVVICWLFSLLATVRGDTSGIAFGGLGRCGVYGVSGLVVGVNAGLLLSGLVVFLSRIFSLSLLATVRGGTSFLCPKRQRNEAKKALSNHRLVSVPSVQAKSFWHLIARCSPD